MSTAFVPIKGDGVKVFWHADQESAPAANAVGWTQIIGVQTFDKTAGTVSNTEIKTMDQPTVTVPGNPALPTYSGQFAVSPKNAAQATFRTKLTNGDKCWIKIQYPSESNAVELNRARKIFRVTLVDGGETLGADAEVNYTFSANCLTVDTFVAET